MPIVKINKKKQRWWTKILKYSWKPALVAAIALPIGYHFFIGWRARDLARKAQESFDQGDYQQAWLQISSARNLRSDDPEMLRIAASMEGKFGQKESLQTWEKLGTIEKLDTKDVEEITKTALRFGDDKQFTAAVAKLEALGANGKAGALRTTRLTKRGDLDQAIVEARRTAEVSGDPQDKLGLARLLIQRHGNAGSDGRPAAEDASALKEVIGIIDDLQTTDSAQTALAIGLAVLPLDPATTQKWAEAAMKNMSATNLALLPAAEFLVRSKQEDVSALYPRLRPIFENAPLAQRADFTLWLTRQGLPQESLGLLTTQETVDNVSAFLARTDALGRLANWSGVLEIVEGAKGVPESMRLITRAWAESSSGDLKAGANSVRSAVRSAAHEGRLEAMLPAVDGMAAGQLADEELTQLCAEPATAGAAFGVLRQRLGRTAGTAALDKIYEEKAKNAAPDALSVCDFKRYLDALKGSLVRLEDTAAAIAEEPSNPALRATHALVLLRRNHPKEAKAAFEDLTIFFKQMTASEQVIVAAFTYGVGEAPLALKMREVINKDILNPGERALLDQFVPEEGSTK